MVLLLLHTKDGFLFSIFCSLKFFSTNIHLFIAIQSSKYSTNYY